MAETPLENIRAGTPPYLDPFLRLRRPPRWDTYAEQFAAAMTLYEMATGQLPTWGDGHSDPSMLDDEVTLDSELFDPAMREGLTQFFAKALARDYRVRFDNAEEMRRVWFRVFEHIDRPTTATDHGEAIDLESMLKDATASTPISALGLSATILKALDRIGAHTLGELVRVPRIRLYRNKGIGQRTVKEIRELAARVAHHLDRGATSEGSLPQQTAGVFASGGMPAWRALKLGLGSLLGPKALTVKQIQQRIGSRYPQAQAVPGPPALDRLLAEAGVELVWDGATQSYSAKSRRSSYLSSTSTLHPVSTAAEGGAASTAEIEEAWRLEERIRKAIEEKRFLVLSVAPKYLLRAERELLKFPIPETKPLELATELNRLARARQAHLPAQLVDRMPLSRAELDAHRAEAESLLRQMIALQEELDWRCYTLYGLTAQALSCSKIGVH